MRGRGLAVGIRVFAEIKAPPKKINLKKVNKLVVGKKYILILVIIFGKKCTVCFFRYTLAVLFTVCSVEN